MTDSTSFASSDALAGLASALDLVTDPRAKRGVRHPFSGILALVFLGLLGTQSKKRNPSSFARQIPSRIHP